LYNQVVCFSVEQGIATNFRQYFIGTRTKGEKWWKIDWSYHRVYPQSSSLFKKKL